MPWGGVEAGPTEGSLQEPPQHPSLTAQLIFSPQFLNVYCSQNLAQNLCSAPHALSLLPTAAVSFTNKPLFCPLGFFILPESGGGHWQRKLLHQPAHPGWCRQSSEPASTFWIKEPAQGRVL